MCECCFLDQADNYWFEELQEMGAVFVHDGNPGTPHALLTTGFHSNGYFNSSAIRSPNQWYRIANVLLSFDAIPTEIQPESIFGSAFGAIPFAYALSQIFDCDFGYTEPEYDSFGVKKMALRRFSVRPNERILVVEDAFTTGLTTLSTIAALRERGAEVLNIIPVVWNRSGIAMLNRRRIVSLMTHTFPMWPEQECPLCMIGSKPKTPKTHWDEFIKST